MKKSQSIMLAQSETRQKLLSIANLTDDKITDDIKKEETELRGKLDDLETQFRAAIAAENVETEQAETEAKKADGNTDDKLSELTSRVRLSRYMTAAVEGRSVDGAELELIQEKKLGTDGVIPFEAIAPTTATAKPRTETRADAATNVADSNIHSTHYGVLGRIFNRTAAAILGTAMPMVSRGDAVYSVLTAGDAGKPEAKGAAHDSVAAVFAGHTIKPTRITARYQISVEDMARFNGLEESLRQDLSMALGVQLDNQVINGTGVAPSFNGILKQLNQAANGDATSYAVLQKILTGSVDGKLAASPSDVRLVISPDTFQTAATTYLDKTQVSAWDYLSMQSGAIGVSAQLPAKTSLATSEGMSAVCAIWEGVQLIRDNVSSAQSGQVNLTAILLAGFELLRTDGWRATLLK